MIDFDSWFESLRPELDKDEEDLPDGIFIIDGSPIAHRCRCGDIEEMKKDGFKHYCGVDPWFLN